MNAIKDNKTGKYVGIISKLDINSILDKISENKTLKQISKELKISPEGLRKFLIRNNISYRKKNKYHCNDLFFNEKNEQSFYWAGFIAADGNISKLGDFTLSIKISDINHIEKFKKITQSSAPINLIKEKQLVINNIKTKSSGIASIRFRNKFWLQSLLRFGIIPNKTRKYDIPNEIINDNNFKHFIRGYFDGDGWLSVRSTYNKKLRFGFGLCGNFSVLEKIQKHLQQQCDIEKLPTIYKQKNIFKFEFNNQYDVWKILNYLYNNSLIFLDRKYELSKMVDKCNTNRLNLSKETLDILYQRLKSYTKIALVLNCSKSAVAKYCKKYGIK